MGSPLSPSVSSTSTNGLDAGVSSGLLQQMGQQSKDAMASMKQAMAELKESNASNMQSLLSLVKEKDFAAMQKDEVYARERIQQQQSFAQAQGQSQQMMASMMNGFMRAMPSIMQQQQQNVQFT